MSDPIRLGDYTNQARQYAQARPTYPVEMIDRLMRRAGVIASDAVADLGAGTGIATRLLAQRGLVVTAIEPNAAMREQAEPMPGVTWLDGRFESLPFENRSQRWVTAAQSLHWADPPRALPELRRVLAPGCCLSAWWNDRANDQSELLGETRDLIRRIVPEFDEAYRDRDWPAVVQSTGDFTDAATDDVLHIVTMSTQRFMTLWRSHNRLNATAGPERMAELLGAIESLLATLDGETVDVPYHCTAVTARRVD